MGMKKVEITAVLIFAAFIASQSIFTYLPKALAQTDNLQIEVQTSPIILDDTATDTTNSTLDSDDSNEEVGGIRGFFQRLFGGNDRNDSEQDDASDDEMSNTLNVQVESGDTLWGIVSGYVANQSNLAAGSNDVYTAAAINAIRKQDLSSLGISSGNVDLIYPGETICFTLNIQSDQTVTINDSAICS
jgi:hypothetical protein